MSRSRRIAKMLGIFYLLSIGVFILAISADPTSKLQLTTDDGFESASATFLIENISEPYIDTDTNFINITYTTSCKVLVLLYPPSGGGYISFDANLAGAGTITKSFALTQDDKVTPDAGEYQIIVYPINDEGRIQGNKIYDSKNDLATIRNKLTFQGANLSVSSFEYLIDNTYGKVKSINVSIENTGDLATFGDHSRIFLRNATHEFDDGWEVSARVNLPPGQITLLLSDAETASVPPGVYDLVLRVIDFSNLLLLEKVLVNGLTITGSLNPGQVPMNYDAIFNFTEAKYPKLYAMTNWLNITFDQSERIYIWLYDPSGRGEMQEVYSVSYPVTSTVEFSLTGGDRQEVSPGTWTWVATTSENAIFYSDFITPIENGTIQIQGHNTQLGSTVSFTEHDGWIKDFRIPIRNTGDVYSFALEILLEFKPESGPSKFYSFYADVAIPPDGVWIDLSNDTFVITDLSPGNYIVDILIWDLSFEIIATQSYNVSIIFQSSTAIGIPSSIIVVILAIGIVISIQTWINLCKRNSKIIHSKIIFK